LDFFQTRALAVDAELWAQGSTLYMQPRSVARGTDVSLTYGDGLLDFVVSANLAGQVSHVQFTGWDVNDKTTILEVADEASVFPELAGDLGGSELLDAAFGPRGELLSDLGPANAQQARRLAESRYREAARRLTTGRGLAVGNSAIHVGTRLVLAGLGDMFNGRYCVTSVTHQYDRQTDMLTAFEVERPEIGRKPSE
jgi:phage protein D